MSLYFLKVLEFEMSFKGHIKLFENDNFALKIDQAPLHL